MRSQKFGLTALCVLALVFLGVIFHFKSETEKTRIYEGCARSMAQMTCSIQSGPKEFSISVKQVFVAGFGSLDADVYRNLKTLGPEMCHFIESECTKDLKSESCRVGRALYLSRT